MSVGTTRSAVGVLLLMCVISSVNSFSKYGRGCNDIGCLPNEECVITSDSCSYTQREGKDCGNYPKCQRKSGSSSASSAPVNPSGSVLNPGYPAGLQPVNPYSPSFVFGQQPYYSMPAGTGGPPGGSNGILGGSGGGLAPPSGYYGNSNVGYQNANMYNKPPPQYQNQNPYNRQTQAHPSGAAHRGGAAASWQTLTIVACGYALLTAFVSQGLAYGRST